MRAASRFRGGRMALAVVACGALVRSAFAAPDPSGAGRFAVGVRTVTVTEPVQNAAFTTDVWYPAAAPGRDASPRGGRWPLVIVVHGFCGSRLNYQYLTIALAAHGFVAAAPDVPGLHRGDCARGVPMPDPTRYLPFLRTVFHDRDGPAADIARHVRGRRTGLAGHSFGGLHVTQAMFADPAFTAVALLAAIFTVDDYRALDPPRAILAIGGTADDLLPYDPTQLRNFALLGPPAWLLQVVGGTHGGFGDVDGNPALVRQHALVQRYAVALFQRWLGRSRAAARILRPADAARQGPDVTLTPVSR